MLAEERTMLALLPPHLSAMHILDAGCGSGRYLVHTANRGATHRIGVDLSQEMLRKARGEMGSRRQSLIQASLDALPITTAWADVTICGLTIGHLEQLEPALAELKRVTRPGGTILISDFHPIGETLGWRREFKTGGQRYAVRHTARSIGQWQASCRSLNLHINTIEEPYLDPTDIPANAQFDQQALTIPVALVLSITTPP
jgi:malonyl-CoA O-methyltransferase